MDDIDHMYNIDDMDAIDEVYIYDHVETNDSSDSQPLLVRHKSRTDPKSIKEFRKDISKRLKSVRYSAFAFPWRLALSETDDTIPLSGCHFFK